MRGVVIIAFAFALFAFSVPDDTAREIGEIVIWFVPVIVVAPFGLLFWAYYPRFGDTSQEPQPHSDDEAGDQHD